MAITIMSSMMSRSQSLVIAGTFNTTYIDLSRSTMSYYSPPKGYLGMSRYCDSKVVLIPEKYVIVRLEDTYSFRKVFMNPTKRGMDLARQVLIGVFNL
jgi:hypothetical protein